MSAQPRSADVVTEAASPQNPRLCCVIVNPSKVSDDFRHNAEEVLNQHGWTTVRWLPTTEDDPGQAMTAAARQALPGLVLAAGGDGTVRLVADGLADSGIPLAIIPAGTGNLLARNLDIPLDEAAALQVAVGPSSRPIDLIQISVDANRSGAGDGDSGDGDSGQRFAVMAGVGVDAVIMDATDSTLKKKVGSLAYFVAAAKHVGHRPFRAVVTVDDQPPLRRRAVVIIIGNVGQLQANIELLPGARPDDGQLNVLVASPRGFTRWLKLIIGVLTRRHHIADDLDHLVGSSVTITLDRRHPYQMDGDTVGHLTTLTAAVNHHALIVKVPSDHI